MSVGEELSRARAQAGLSVDDVAAATMIRATLVRAIESDDFERCGGAVYARGHIRSIAHVIGVDAEPLVATFDAEHGGAPAPSVPAAEAGTSGLDRTAMKRSGPRRPHWMVAAGVVLVIVCVLAGISLARGGSNAAHQQHTAQKTPPAGAHHHRSPPASPSPQHSPSPTASSPAPTKSKSPITVPDGVTVALRVTGTESWCKFTGDHGRVLFSGLLSHGQAKKFSADKTLKVVIGDTRQVDLVVNGHNVGRPAGNGYVADLAFGPDDPSPKVG
jgi:cytoskeletal protein RodZ